MTYLQINPARAKEKDPEELWDDDLWIAEQKMDGWRFLMHFGRDLDRVYMTGKRPSSRTMRLSEKGLCAPCLWPEESLRRHIGYTVLDGEVRSPTDDWRDVAGIMNVDPEAAAARIAEIGRPTYTVWDVLFYDGVDLREKMLSDRRKILGNIFNLDLDHDLIRHVQNTRVGKREFYDYIVSNGGEGVVLKHLGSAYDEEDPSMRWVKVKKTSTIDCIITGFVEAKLGVTGKYLGQVGSLRVSVYGADGKTLIEVACVSGFSDELRLQISNERDKWMGRVIEIEAREFSKERLTQPRFRRERPDADPKSCTFTKMLIDLSSKKREAPQQLSLL